MRLKPEVSKVCVTALEDVTKSYLKATEAACTAKDTELACKFWRCASSAYSTLARFAVEVGVAQTVAKYSEASEANKLLGESEKKIEELLKADK